MKHPFRPRLLLGASFGALLMSAAACGPLRMGNNQRATLIFSNETLDQADVFATIAGTQTVRIGTVLSRRTDTLTVPASVTGQGGNTNIVVHMLAQSYTPSSGPVTLRAGDVLTVRLPPDARSLVVLPNR
jgi:hypothetical protein